MKYKDKIKLSLPKKNDPCMWADYIELECLISLDEMINISDVIDEIQNAGLLGEKKYYDFLEEEITNNNLFVDEIEKKIENFFEVLRFRRSYFGDSYPFDVTRDSISIKRDIDLETSVYVFLLICSNLRMLSDITITNDFERFCHKVQDRLFSGFFKTSIFGTSREFGYKGNLEKRIIQLADEMNLSLTKSASNEYQRKKIPFGDDGIDVVSYCKIDNQPYIPMVFSQCTCSREEWLNKQRSIFIDRLSKRFEPMIPYIPIMYVPFFDRFGDGNFEKSLEIQNVLFDRGRLVKLADLCNIGTEDINNY